MSGYNADKHNGHLIYAAATPSEGNKRWHAEGIVFSTNFTEPVEKIHRMKNKLDFGMEKQARDHAIALCKIWIDRQKEEKRLVELRSRLTRLRRLKPWGRSFAVGFALISPH